MLSFEEFCASYKSTGVVPMAIGRRSKPLTEQALEREYPKYVQKVERQKSRAKEKLAKVRRTVKTPNVDEREKELVREVRERDVVCVLTNRLSPSVLAECRKSDLFNQQLLDVAHIVSRAVAPKMKYDPDNCVLLNRLFHSRLDSYQNPLTGDSVTAEERDMWWRVIVGDDLWEELQRRKLA